MPDWIRFGESEGEWVDDERHVLNVAAAATAVNLHANAQHPSWEAAHGSDFQAAQIGEDPDLYATTLDRLPFERAPQVRSIGWPSSQYEFSFDEVVTDVAFTISGLRGGSEGRDVVMVTDGSTRESVGPVGALAPAGTQVTWVAAEGRYEGGAELGDEPGRSVAGRIEVYIAGPLTSFTVEMGREAGETESPASYVPGQTLWLSDIEFMSTCSVPD